MQSKKIPISKEKQDRIKNFFAASKSICDFSVSKYYFKMATIIMYEISDFLTVLFSPFNFIAESSAIACH